MLTRELRFLRPWVFGASVWLMLSLIVSLAHLRSGQPHYLFELGGLMTLLWIEFGFAGMFHTLRKEKGRKVIPLLLITLLPPLALFCIDFVLLG
jgi:hypothetical protein